MALKDIVFGIGLKSDKFDEGMRRCAGEIRKMAGIKLAGLEAEMARLSKATDAISKKRLSGLLREWTALDKVLKSTGSEAKKTGGFLANMKTGFGMGAGISIMSGAIGGLDALIIGAFTKVKDIFVNSIADGIKSNQVSAALRDAMRNAGQDPAMFEPLQAAADSAMRAFNIDDESIKQGMATMITGGLSAADAIGKVGLMADIAAKKGMTMTQAGMVISRVYGGEVGQLRRLGILIAATGDKRRDAVLGMEALSRATQGAAATQAGLASPWEAIRIAVGEIMESFGQKLIPRLLPILRTIANFINAFAQSDRMEQIMNAVVTTITNLFNWGMALIQSIDFNTMGKSLWVIIKEIASFLFDVLVAAGTAIGEKIKESITGFKSVGQGYLDKAWNKYGNMTKGQQAGEMQSLRDEEAGLRKGGLINQAQANERLQQMRALQQVQGDTRIATSGPSMSDVIAAHTAKAQTMAAGPTNTFFGNLAAQGATQLKQDMAKFAAPTTPIGYSARAAQVEANKTAKKRGPAHAKAVNRQRQYALRYNQRQGVDVRVTSLDGHIHPAYVH